MVSVRFKVRNVIVLDNHDLGRVWAMTLDAFDAEYYTVAALTVKIPKNSQV